MPARRRPPPGPAGPELHRRRPLPDRRRGRYRFVTVRPGAYPWKNSPNAWRPAHIHFSLFGRAFVQRLVTQMYFPGDPLFAQDAIALAVPEPARDRLVASLDLQGSMPEWALAYRFDIVLRSTPFEESTCPGAA